MQEIVQHPDKVTHAGPKPKPPSNRPHKATKDLRKHFAEVTAKTPIDHAFRAAFVQSKVRLAHTHAANDLAARDLAVRSIIDRLGGEAKESLDQLTAAAPHALTQPVPGGVGYGMFYNAGFKTGWGRGTSFAYDIVCPTPPGGNVSTWLYLTATNRSGKGVEAFVSYNGQSDTHFRVFDWARADHWQTDCPFGTLGNYLRTESAHGHPYQALPVWNSTWLLSGSTWRNQVLLYNHVRGGWDLIYQYDYSATDT